MTKKLVYVAHPYGGKESNKNKIDKIMKELVLNSWHIRSIISGVC